LLGGSREAVVERQDRLRLPVLGGEQHAAGRHLQRRIGEAAGGVVA
jgi:hypothetical protein